MFELCLVRYASEVAEQVASRAVEGMGGMGFVKSSVAEKFFRDSKIGKIYEGTSNICLQVVKNSVECCFCGDLF
jgi:short/branched chain acyl-CoA dehydrogenase